MMATTRYCGAHVEDWPYRSPGYRNQTCQRLIRADSEKAHCWQHEGKPNKVSIDRRFDEGWADSTAYSNYIFTPNFVIWYCLYGPNHVWGWAESRTGDPMGSNRFCCVNGCGAESVVGQ